MAVSWAYAQAGSTVFARKARYAYVPYLVWDAHQGRNNLTLTSAPNSGDVVAYDWNGDGVGDHCGLFVKWTNKHDGAFVALEGNTAVGNDSNGGEVMHRDRNMSQVQAMIHVGK
jgi:hypothetical protein